MSISRGIDTQFVYLALLDPKHRSTNHLGLSYIAMPLIKQNIEYITILWDYKAKPGQKQAYT